MKPKTMMIDEVKYVRADSVNEQSDLVDGLQYCIFRTYSAGVFAGYLKEKKAEANGVNCIIVNARRLWRWAGACSLSQLSVDGSNDPGNCKFSIVVPSQEINNVIEIIPTSKNAKKNIEEMAEWKS